MFPKYVGVRGKKSWVGKKDFLYLMSKVMNILGKTLKPFLLFARSRELERKTFQFTSLDYSQMFKSIKLNAIH